MHILLLLTLSFLHPQAVGVDRVAWIQGCWKTENPQRTIEEYWTAPRGDSMIGMGRTVRGGKLVDYEMVIIRPQGNQLAYEAHPAGQPSAVFLSTTVTDSLVTFENPQHDFPQKIGYQQTAPDRLLAWVEGNEKGQNRRIEFPYQRAACPPVLVAR